MIKILVAIFFAVALSACDTTTERQVVVWACNCEEKAAAANWVGEHIGDANNHSDEEMEDVILQLQKTAVQLHCKRLQMQLSTDNAGNIRSAPNDSCVTIYDY